LDYVVYQGGITLETFIDFVEHKVLSYCNPRPGLRLVLVLDNTSIPLDFNPIETTFHDLKAWIKRNHHLANNFTEFGSFLEYAVSQGGENIRAYYGKADYISRVCMSTKKKDTISLSLKRQNPL
jgi:hypothetical protein